MALTDDQLLAAITDAVVADNMAEARLLLESERRLVVERVRDRIKFARIGGTEWSEVYAPQLGWLLDAELEGKDIR